MLIPSWARCVWRREASTMSQFKAGESGIAGIRSDQTSATLRRLLNFGAAVALAVGAVLIAAATPSSVFFLRAPGRASLPSTLVLRGTVQATQEIPVYAR